MFAYNDNQLRGVKIDGAPWFVARDALMCLGVSSVGGTTRHLSGLDDDEKGKDIFLTPGGPQLLVTISRPGLLKLIARSSKPEAKAFDRWVRHEVLPQIMDNGGYVARDADVAAVVEAAPDNKARTLGLRNAFPRAGQLTLPLGLWNVPPVRPGTPPAHPKRTSGPPSGS